MKTCKTLFAAGLPILVANYSDDGFKKLDAAFLTFLLADQHTRIPFLPSFNVDLTLQFLPAQTARWVDLLTEVLQLSTHLEKLHLGIYFAMSLDSSQLMTSIGNCSSLTSLSLCLIRSRMALPLFSNIRAPLRSLSLDFIDRSDHFSISEHLRNLKSSLEYFSLSNTQWFIAETHTLEWPRMKTLGATYFPESGSLSAAFPHLLHLQIVDRDSSIPPQEWTWTHLHEVMLFVPALQQLLPMCTIDRLTVLDAPSADTEPQVVERMINANPSMLGLHSYISADAQMLHTDQIWEAASTVRHLFLTLKAG